MEIRAQNTNSLADVVYGIFMRDFHNVTHQTSRNGPVLRIREPVAICIHKPWQRVNFCPVRDANPFFHLMEGLAMLGPLNSVQYLAHFAKNMASFSDDGVTFNAFYGSRARARPCRFKDLSTMDQFHEVIDILLKDLDSRRAVVDLWDHHDLLMNTQDMACNLSLLFDIQDNHLCMTSYNRSNDAILGGVSGANIVHLSMFQEYVACAVGLPMGAWWHVSNNLHIYTENPKWAKLCGHYASHGAFEKPLHVYPDTSQNMFSMQDRLRFDRELTAFLTVTSHAIRGGLNATVQTQLDNAFLQRTALPMFNAWQERISDPTGQTSLETIKAVQAADWRIAAYDWVKRRAA